MFIMNRETAAEIILLKGDKSNIESVHMSIAQNELG